jgi:hypothetical protein
MPTTSATTVAVPIKARRCSPCLAGCRAYERDLAGYRPLLLDELAGEATAGTRPASHCVSQAGRGGLTSSMPRATTPSVSRSGG